MADIRPFRAIRPREDLVTEIAALPYDVYSRKEAYDLMKGNTLSFLRIDRPETQFPEDYDMYSDEVYKKAHDMLWEMVEKGEFIQDQTPCYYVYALTMVSWPAPVYRIISIRLSRSMKIPVRKRNRTEFAMWIPVMRRPVLFSWLTAKMM